MSGYPFARPTLSTEIVFDCTNSKRYIQVGAGAIDPDGIVMEAGEDYPWRVLYADDSANSDRQILRTMRITFSQNRLLWGIQKADGSFDVIPL